MVPTWRAFHSYEQFSFSGKSLSSFSTSSAKSDSMIDPQNKIRLCIHPDQWVSNFRTTGKFVKAQPSGTQPRPAYSIGLGVGNRHVQWKPWKDFERVGSVIVKTILLFGSVCVGELESPLLVHFLPCRESLLLPG